MSTAFTYSNLFRALAVSFLVAQAAVWFSEIRVLGFKPWFRASMKQSYVRYFRSLSSKERVRLFGLWASFFVVAVVLLALI